MDVQQAADRWARTWAQAWPAKEPERIAALYAENVTYRSRPTGEPQEGGALGYTRREFAREDAISCRFDKPISADDRAAVQWWASWVEDGEELTLAGVTVLRFDTDGRVVEHVDYWEERPGRIEPFSGWGA